MSYKKLKFGSHKGKTLPEVLFCDPGWFYWAYNKKKVFKNQVEIEAKSLYKKAGNIMIPALMDEDMVVDYFWSHGKIFAGFEIVSASKPEYEGEYDSFRDKVIDFELVYRWNPHDKNGYQIFIRQYKYYRFGAKDLRMSKKDCEAFFEDNNNFAIEIESKNDDADSSQKCWMKPLFEGSFKIKKR